MFTRDQIEEIKKKLTMLGTKDTQFPDAHKLNGEEIIAIVQDGENKKIPLSSIINDDFINVSKDTTEILTLSTAVSKIDTNNRKLGQVITFKDSANSWAIRQFTGGSLDNWNDISLWKSISGIDELKSQVETNAEDISVLSDEIERHDASILNLNTDVSKLKDKDIETSSSLSELTTRVDTLKSQADTNTSNISSINTEVSTLQSKVDENTTSISQINNTIADHEESISQINTKLEEHTESINSKITTDRIEDGAVTSEKIATSAFDDTLSVSGNIAPADVVGGKLTELGQETTKAIDGTIIGEILQNGQLAVLEGNGIERATETRSGFINKNGNLVEYANFQTAIINVTEYKAYKINVPPSGSESIINRLHLFGEENGSSPICGSYLVEYSHNTIYAIFPPKVKSISVTTSTKYTLSVLEYDIANSKTFSFFNSKNEELKQTISALESETNTKLTELEQQVETFYDVVEVKGSNNLLDLTKITNNKKIDSSNGTIYDGSNYSVSDYIEIEASTYLFNTGRITTSPIRKAAVYDENKNFLEIIDSGALTDRVTISNESAKYIILQFGTAALNAAIAVDGHVQFTKGTSVIPYEEYRAPFRYTKPRIKPNMISSIVNGILKVEKSTLGNGEELALDDFPQCNKKNDRFSFFAKITTFEGLTFKVGDSGSLSGWVTITPTDIECYQGQTPDTPKSTFAHGLTINKYISVQIKVLNNGTLSVRVMTENGDKIITYNYWSYNIYRVKRWVSNSTLYDVVATATNKDYTCPIWVFGASYETINADDTSSVNKNRWIDHVRDFGFFNYLVNARGGRNSEETYADLLKALKFGTPRYLLWTMFGNDATAEELSLYIEKVKKLAIDKGFEVILTKRPSTPTLDNSEKINVIVNSGCRYIDYERVLIESGNNWYAGYLSSDGVHPTVLGAKAIASSVLTDFIEITQY